MSPVSDPSASAESLVDAVRGLADASATSVESSSPSEVGGSTGGEAPVDSSDFSSLTASVAEIHDVVSATPTILVASTGAVCFLLGTLVAAVLMLYVSSRD